MTLTRDAARQSIADRIAAALGVARVAGYALRIDKAEDGRWHVVWDAGEQMSDELVVTYDKLAALSRAFATTAINVRADPGSDGDPTYGGGGSKGHVHIEFWPGNADEWIDAVRDDIITKRPGRLHFP